MAWLNIRDKKAMEMYDIYFQCVEAEYGVTPQMFYEINGAYPPCR